MLEIQSYQPEDRDQLNALAVTAFLQFKAEYENWEMIESAVGKMSELHPNAEILVAKQAEELVGAIALVKPGLDKKHGVDPTWASIRMLVVSPCFRGQGIGKALALESIRQAKQNNYRTISLYTSPIMKVALPMYLKMGFIKIKNIEPISGVEYALYKLDI